MIKQYSRLSLCVATVLLISCSIFSQPKLPSAWQPGMKLSMSYGGGMRYYSYKLEITDTASSFMENVEGKVTYYKLDLSKKDLDSLLQFMNRKHFTKIEEEMTGPVHDKGTKSLVLAWDDRVIGLSEGYSQRITDKYRDDYNAICNYIDQLRDRTKRKVKNLREKMLIN